MLHSRRSKSRASRSQRNNITTCGISESHCPGILCLSRSSTFFHVFLSLSLSLLYFSFLFYFSIFSFVFFYQNFTALTSWNVTKCRPMDDIIIPLSTFRDSTMLFGENGISPERFFSLLEGKNARRKGIYLKYYQDDN